jgi:hypothetical protein
VPGANGTDQAADFTDDAAAAAFGFGGAGRGRAVVKDGGELTPLVYAVRADDPNATFWLIAGSVAAGELRLADSDLADVQARSEPDLDDVARQSFAHATTLRVRLLESHATSRIRGSAFSL